MTGPPPGSDQRPAPEDVARDLAAIEARLKTAQAELEAVTKERRDALERLGRLHADRMAEEGAAGQEPGPAGERGTPD
jgi:hypothetical protein